jgi:proteasome beta subunit
MALTTAGTVSDVELLVKLIKAELKLKEIRTGRKNTVKEAANLLAGMVYSNIRRMSMIPGISHFLFAGMDKSIHLYDLYPDGSISEVDDFVATGSGSPLAYGVLESRYKKGLSQDQGVQLALQAVNAALQRDSATGDGIDVMAINKAGVKKILTKELVTKL